MRKTRARAARSLTSVSHSDRPGARRTGDIVFGDLDGVCIVPCAAEEEVLARAFEKARKEKVVRKALEEGMPSKAAFEKYGIL